MATFQCLRPTQSTWSHSYVHDQFRPHSHTPIYIYDQSSPHGHTPISTDNSVHMATFLCPRSIQSTWPHSNFYDQLSPHGHILMFTINSVHMATLLSISTINPVHMTTLLYLRTTQATWPHSYAHDQFSPHGRTATSTINPVHMAALLHLQSIQTTWPHSYVHDQFSTHYPHSCLHNQSTVLPSTSRFFKCYITWLPAPIHTKHT